MAITGQRRKRYRKHNFLVETDGIERAGFVTCSALKATVEPIEFREGGDLEPEKLPGLANMDNITLTYGVSDDFEFWEWFQQVANFRLQGGLTDDEVIRSMEIVQQDRDNSDKIRWPIQEAWPSEITLGDWDKNANEVNMKEVVLAVRGVQSPILL